MILIDRYAYCNKFIGVHPIEKFLFSIGCMILSLFLNSILVSSLVFLLVGALLVLGAGIPLKFYLKILFLPISFLVLGLLTIAIDIGNTGFLCSYSFGSWQIGVTEKGLATAGNLFFNAMAAVSCLYFLSLTTPMVEIIALLRKGRAPELFLELMSLIYRFIFVLIETADKIYLSQSSRLGYADLKKGYRSLGHLGANLFLRAFKRSNELYDSLEARGYNGKLRVLEKRYSFSPLNIAIIVLLDCFLIVIANIN